VTADGDTVASVLAGLEAAHPGFTERLFDEGGQLRRFVNVFVADEDIRFLDGVDTPVAEGQTVSIVPAVAGG
jgi:molybdopterin synthase sulfur carrier subunit